MANPNVGGTNGMNAAERAAQAKEVSGNNSNANRTGAKSGQENVKGLEFCAKPDPNGNVDFSQLAKEISRAKSSEIMDKIKNTDPNCLIQKSNLDTNQLNERILKEFGLSRPIESMLNPKKPSKMPNLKTLKADSVDGKVEKTGKGSYKYKDKDGYDVTVGRDFFIKEKGDNKISMRKDEDEGKLVINYVKYIQYKCEAFVVTHEIPFKTGNVENYIVHEEPSFNRSISGKYSNNGHGEQTLRTMSFGVDEKNIVIEYSSGKPYRVSNSGHDPFEF